LGMTHTITVLFVIAAACIILNIILKSMVDTDDPDFIQRTRWPNRDK
jgi:hypothetical protein